MKKITIKDRAFIQSSSAEKYLAAPVLFLITFFFHGEILDAFWRLHDGKHILFAFHTQTLSPADGRSSSGAEMYIGEKEGRTSLERRKTPLCSPAHPAFDAFSSSRCKTFFLLLTVRYPASHAVVPQEKRPPFYFLATFRTIE